MTENSSKIYPASSDSVAQMLGFKVRPEDSANLKEENEISPADLPVANLSTAHPAQANEAEKPESFANHVIPKEDVDKEMEELNGKPSLVKKIFKAALPYIMVFAVGLGAYYFFLADASVNFSGIFKAKAKPAKLAPLTVKDSKLTELQKSSGMLETYQKWISQFYFEISDPAVIDPEADNSGNGLTNFQKFLLELNPKNYDSLGLGMSDSQAIINGINPLTGGQLTQKQKDIVENYFDLEIINNRLAMEQLRRAGLVAGSINRNLNRPAREAARSDNRSGVRQLNANQAGGFDNPVNPEINSGDLDIDTPGRLEIPSLNINVPIIFTRDPKNFEKDLQSGVAHYPGTAIPGQIGTAYISGHSSNYLWAKGDYNKVFSKLGDLPDNSSFVITVVQKGGRDARFNYVVTHRKEFSPTDQEQFKNTGESVAALSTCWPVGSTKSRLVVFGKLTQVEK